MIFVKSLIAGIVAVIGYVVLVVLVFLLAVLWRTRGGEEGVGIIMAPGRLILAGALLIFGAAFVLAFRRL